MVRYSLGADIFFFGGGRSIGSFITWNSTNWTNLKNQYDPKLFNKIVTLLGWKMFRIRTIPKLSTYKCNLRIQMARQIEVFFKYLHGTLAEHSHVFSWQFRDVIFRKQVWWRWRCPRRWWGYVTRCKVAVWRAGGQADVFGVANGRPIVPALTHEFAQLRHHGAGAARVSEKC